MLGRFVHVVDGGARFWPLKMSLRLTALDWRGYALPAQPVPTAPLLNSGRSLVSCCIRQEQKNGTSARTRYHDQPSSENSGSISRRAVTSTVFLCLASAALGSGEASFAEEAKENLGPSVVESVLSFFDSEETTKSGRRLPKAYIQNAKEVVKTLRDSLGDDVASFRKNADTAKQAIKTYILNWRGSKSVDTEESYVSLERALRVLGGFYSKKGPNAVLPKDVKAAVLADLDKAEAAL